MKTPTTLRDLEIVSVDNEAMTITMLIRGRRYTYCFRDGFPAILDQVRRLGRNKGRRLAYIKRVCHCWWKDDE